MTNEEAIDHLSVIAERMNDKGRMIYVGDVALEAVDMAIETLKVRKTGKWVHNAWLGGYYCSACDKGGWTYNVSPRWKACPWCGVKMEVDE